MPDTPRVRPGQRALSRESLHKLFGGVKWTSLVAIEFTARSGRSRGGGLAREKFTVANGFGKRRSRNFTATNGSGIGGGKNVTVANGSGKGGQTHFTVTNGSEGGGGKNRTVTNGSR